MSSTPNRFSPFPVISVTCPGDSASIDLFLRAWARVFRDLFELKVEPDPIVVGPAWDFNDGSSYKTGGKFRTGFSAASDSAHELEFWMVPDSAAVEKKRLIQVVIGLKDGSGEKKSETYFQPGKGVWAVIPGTDLFDLRTLIKETFLVAAWFDAASA